MNSGTYPLERSLFLSSTMAEDLDGSVEHLELILASSWRIVLLFKESGSDERAWSIMSDRAFFR